MKVYDVCGIALWLMLFLSGTVFLHMGITDWSTAPAEMLFFIFFMVAIFYGMCALTFKEIKNKF